MNVHHIRRKLSAATAVVVFAALAASCAANGTSGGGEVKTLRYLGSGGGGAVQFPELADALGYLDGIKLKNVGQAAGGPALIQGVATHQIDFGGPFDSTIVVANAAKTPVTAVIGYMGTDEKNPSAFYVRADSGIKSARDLIGKKVALNTLGAAYEAFLDTYLIKNGFTGDELKKVTRVVLPPANSELALRTKRVDAVTLSTPQWEVARKKPGLRELFSTQKLLGNFTQASYVMGNKFIKDNPTTTRKFVAGTAKAIVWTQTHTPEETIAVYSKWLTAHGRSAEIPLLKYWKSQSVASVGGAITTKEFATWITWLETKGEIKKGSVNPGDLFTNKFNPYGKDIKPASEAKAG